MINFFYCPLLSRIPEDSPLDMCSPTSTEENIGLFMLRKDSERRATLHRVLTDYISHVISNIQESVPQVGEEMSQWHRSKHCVEICRLNGFLDDTYRVFSGIGSPTITDTDYQYWKGWNNVLEDGTNWDLQVIQQPHGTDYLQSVELILKLVFKFIINY